MFVNRLNLHCTTPDQSNIKYYNNSENLYFLQNMQFVFKTKTNQLRRQHPLGLAVGGQQLWHLALKTAATLIVWVCRCPSVHDVRANLDQVGHKYCIIDIHCAAIAGEQFCAGPAYLEQAEWLKFKAVIISDGVGNTCVWQVILLWGLFNFTLHSYLGHWALSTVVQTEIKISSLW